MLRRFTERSNRLENSHANGLFSVLSVAFSERHRTKGWFPLGVNRRRSVKNRLFFYFERCAPAACDLRLMETSLNFKIVIRQLKPVIDA